LAWRSARRFVHRWVFRMPLPVPLSHSIVRW
jgi:hypothetical protein